MIRSTACLFSVFLIVSWSSCRQAGEKFTRLKADQTGIRFNNTIAENDSVNPLDLEFLYNGGGIAAADFNNDSLTDLYFTASLVSNKLYLNRGNMKFDDVTESSDCGGEGMWSNAATVVDINNDGFNDIYVCTTIYKDPSRRTNLLYVNQGLDADGIPHFKEMAAACNLADTSFSVQAAFLDYDGDGDLDMYLVNTQLAQRNSTRFDGSKVDESAIPRSTDKLYRNDGAAPGQLPLFTEVSRTAGIIDNGYGLAVAVSDLNQDGWPDIYVTNDFLASDLVYINNQKGGFNNHTKLVLRHSSQNAMGVDIADFNNDGLQDIVSADMNPEDNYRKKKNLNANNYFITQNMENLGYTLQYVRNTLQLNNGMLLKDSSQMTLPLFSDISFYAGVAETDWSWSTLLADMDNDGRRDLMITNGYPRDVTDHDFASYRNKAVQVATKEQLLDQIPAIKIPNYAFRNSGHYRFENATADWNMQEASFSSGAACVDLDNDGDLDYVVNNINDEAFVYRNNNNKNTAGHFIKFTLKGSPTNLQGVGTKISLYSDSGRVQFAENFSTHGYLSSTGTALHFGLGNTTIADSVIVQWPDGRWQKTYRLNADATYPFSWVDSSPDTAFIKISPQESPWFEPFRYSTGLPFRHQEMDHIDFNTQRLLPHKLSQYGPALAVADINNDGLDDWYIAASAGADGSFFIQQKSGSFLRKDLDVFASSGLRKTEQMGALFFDADNDNDADLCIVSGSYEFPANTANYRDHFFINDGKGNFKADTMVLPVNLASKSCVRAADFDHDGDLDLFIGGRVNPGNYPSPVNSFIYRNDSENGRIRFTDVTAEVAPSLLNIGLVCDALWTDFDNDGWTDLVLAGEWMPLSFLKNDGGKFTNITEGTGLQNNSGWWNSLVAADLDRDGDIDYVAGNLGLNSYFRSRDSSRSIRIYAYDFDQNKSYDAIPAMFFGAADGTMKEFPVFSRDDMVKQIVGMRSRFPNYKSFAVAEMKDVLTDEERSKALILEAGELRSAAFINKGNGKFEMIALPPEAQFGPVYGMICEDVNADGIADLLATGNDYGTEVFSGRMDALNGLLMLGKGDGSFTTVNPAQHRFIVPGDGKALVRLTVQGQPVWIASQNRDTLVAYRSRITASAEKIPANATHALIRWKDGKISRKEFYRGQGFLSQSSNDLYRSPLMESITYFHWDKQLENNSR